MAQWVYDVASSVRNGELLRTLSTGSPTAFLGVFAELMATCAPASGEAIGALGGRLPLAHALDTSGGILRADVAQYALAVSRAALQSWRDGRRALALPLSDVTFG